MNLFLIDPLLAPLEVYCPRCGRKTNCIQSLKSPVLVAILYLPLHWVNLEYLGCPRCVRYSLLRGLLWSVLLANGLCWITVPIYLFQILNSSRKEQAGLPPGYLERYGATPHLIRETWTGTPEGKGLRFLVVLVVLAVVLAVVFLILPRLAQ